jgi:hypothetical protein
MARLGQKLAFGASLKVLSIEGLQQEHSAPGVKQQLAAVRILFEWLIISEDAYG